VKTQDLIAVAHVCEFFAVLCEAYERDRYGMPGLQAVAYALETVGISHGDLGWTHKGVWVFSFGAYGCTHVLTTGALEDALEDAAGGLPRGMFTDPDPTDARAELGPGAGEEAIWDLACQDLTYTESGYLCSWEWTCREVTLDDLAEMAVSR
jgi:hypothetical protein